MAHKILGGKFSDLIITIPIFILIVVSTSYLFVLDAKINDRGFLESFEIIYQKFPLVYAAIYLGLKASIEDFVRIYRHEEVTMPGYAYLAHGLQWFVMFATTDLFYKSSYVNAVDTSVGTASYLLGNPLVLWTIADILVSVIYFPRLKNRSISKSHFEDKLIKQILVSTIVFQIIGLISIF